MKKYLMTMAMGIFVAVAMTARGQDEQSLWSATDEGVLIQAIESSGDAPDDIFLKNIACKRLAMIGSDAAIPALVAMLPNEKLNFNARFALEAMTSAASADALIAAATELSGSQQIGVIDSIGVRSLPTAVPTLVGLLEKAPSPELKKAVFTALGFIATDEAIGFLMGELEKPLDPNPLLQRALADALFNVAETCRQAGDSPKAVKIYDAVTEKEFPTFVRKAASYNAMLTLKGSAGERVVEKLQSEKECCFDGALKTLREYDRNAAPWVVRGIGGIFRKLSPERQALVLLALREAKIDDYRSDVLPFIMEQVKSPHREVKIAAFLAMGKLGSAGPDQVLQLATSTATDAGLLDAMVEMAVSLPKGRADKFLAKYIKENVGDVSGLSDDDAARLVALLKVIELRRIKECGPEMVNIASTPSVKPEVRDAALAALSETVSLDQLGLLADALAGEVDDAKVDWILRAACTRLPREDCAAKVAEMFDGADAENKAKLLTLLKQIGGAQALAKVEAACYLPETADKATEVLGQWNTPDDLDQLAAACLKLATEAKENKYKVRGIRSYIRIPRQFSMEPAKRFAMCKTAFDAASRGEDKALIFEIFKRVVEAQSASAALEYTKYPEYKEAACEAAVAVAEKVQGTSDELSAAMKKVIATTGNNDLKARAQKVLDRK